MPETKNFRGKFKELFGKKKFGRIFWKGGGRRLKSIFRNLFTRFVMLEIIHDDIIIGVYLVNFSRL